MNRWLALIVLCTGFLMIILDQTVVNVALPSIEANLRFSEASLAWVINGYLITFGGLLLLSGRIGDLVGRKQVFLAGLVLFTGASLWCGLSTSQAMLIAARFVQGAGAAVTSAVILGMIVTLFTGPAEVGRAIGIYSFVGAGGGSIGLLVGGALTQAINWHWIFFINVPIGVVVAAAGLRVLPNDGGIGLANGADLLGALLITAGVMLGVYAILETSAYGWASARTAGFGAAAIALLALFAVRQAAAGNPLVPLHIFRSRNLAGGNIILILLLAGSFGQFFFGSLYLRQVLGYDPLQIGLSFLPVAVLIGTLSMVASPRLNARFGARNVLAPALLIIAVGLVVLFIRTPVGGHYASDVLPGLLLLGIGGGLGFPALVTVAMSGAAPEDSGLASGIVNTTQQVGGALGLAVLASLAAVRTSHLAAAGIPAKAALTSGYHLAFAVAAALVGGGAVLALTVLRPQPVATASAQTAQNDQPEATVDRSGEMAE